MHLRNIIFFCVLILFYHSLSAQTCTSNGSKWGKNADWSCPNFPQGDMTGYTIIINSNITINETITLTGEGIKIIINDGYSLSFGGSGQLKLPEDALIDVGEGASIIASSNSANTLIEIGGVGKWGKACESSDPESCNNGSLTGPGTMDKNFTPGTTTLPIELLYFKGETSKRGVDLEWATASEKNFDYFSIERSSDARSFTSIAELKGQGNSNVPVNYAYIDPMPLHGLNYYRLKSIDFDGYTEYFKVIAVYITPAKQIVQVYPNPVQGDKVIININTESGDQVEMLLQDLSGKTILQQKLDKARNEVTLKPMIDLGTYILVVKSPKINHSQLLIVK